MKTLADEISLVNRLETVTLSELRKQPGEVFACVALGKTFIVTPPGTQLAITVEKDGKQHFTL